MLSLNAELKEFVCALSDDRHYVREPVVLSSCNHCACNECLSSQKRNKIKCNLCGIETKRNSNSDKISRFHVEKINSSLNKFFGEFEEQMKYYVDLIKSKVFFLLSALFALLVIY